ncbi:Utp14-domain-containing protein [Saitoella complicata NRRL Y-17804]|nr:Utp14-domain-containing protein [Saitoella complicata NRRL Y-17804]ODQ53429.1 Utp14-domain-containing protein [Saitoella complicata NRRL Y-17804]
MARKQQRNKGMPAVAKPGQNGNGKGKAPDRAPARTIKGSRSRALNAFDLAEDDDHKPQKAIGGRRGKAFADAEEEESEDEGVKTEDDEEIDSDEAWDSDDEEKYGDWSMRGSRTTPGGQPKKRGESVGDKGDEEEGEEIDLNEDEDAESDEEDEEEYMDLSEMLGGSSKPAAPTKKSKKPEPVEGEDEDELDLDEDEDEDDMDDEDDDGLDGLLDPEDSGEEELDSEEEDDEDEEEDKMELPTDSEDEDEEDEDKLAAVRNLIAKEYASEKRSTEDAVKDAPIAKRSRVTTIDRNESRKESEYNLSSSNKISLSDLTGTLSDPTLRDAIKTFDPKDKVETLAAPLPTRVQARVDRQAAFKLAKEEVSKWQDTVKRNREADHLFFPMNEPAKQVATAASMTSQFQPSTELEKEVDEVLKESGLKTEKTVSAFEDLAMNKLSIEEVAKRRTELRQMRELMFREEIKARRVSKIKSKAYRKVHKKERDAQEAAVRAAEGIDPEEERMRLEQQRAEERMTQRHKNTRGNVRMNHTDEETRADMEESLRRRDELTRRIQGKESDEESSDDDDEVGEWDELAAVAAAKKAGEDKEVDGGVKLSKGFKGLMNMKFMQNAAAEQARKNRAELDDFEAEMTGKRADEEDAGAGTRIGQNAGRRVFAPGAGTDGEKPTARLTGDEDGGIWMGFEDDDDEDVLAVHGAPVGIQEGQVTYESRPANGKKGGKNAKPLSNGGGRVIDEPEESNPWLAAGEGPLVQSRKTQNLLTKDSTKQEKAASKLKRKRGAAEDEADVEIDVNATLKIVSDNEDDDEDNDAAVLMVHAKGKKAVKFQRDLVARAFAGDDVVQEFEAEKQQTMEDEGDKEEDLTLPGWGSWTGAGVRKHKKAKKIVKVTKGIDPTKRKDAKLQGVVINEKRNKHNSKYLATKLPHEFETRDQYERTLAHAIGPQWNTRDAYQKMTMPRVITKRGKIVDPLEKPMDN